MLLKLLIPTDFLQASLRALPVDRNDIERFKAAFVLFAEQTQNADKESEEHLKNIVADFLKDAFYKKTNYINTKDRKDLVIHTGPNAQTHVGVIIEAKKPENRAEMVSVNKPNTKALHELLLYYLRERQNESNRELKHLVVTNIKEWFFFDAADFERHIYNNKKLLKQYDDWQAARRLCQQQNLLRDKNRLQQSIRYQHGNAQPAYCRRPAKRRNYQTFSGRTGFETLPNADQRYLFGIHASRNQH